jgi:hypothetical protein
MDERSQLLMLRGAIAELPQSQQDQIKALAARIREVLAPAPELGMTAMALVALEESAR